MEVHPISSWNFTIRGKTIPHPKSSQYTWKQAEKPKTKYNRHPTQRIYFQNRWKVDASTKIIAKHSNWLFRLGKAAFLGAMKVDEPAESKGEFSLPSHGFIPLRSGTPQYLAPEVASTLARYDEHLVTNVFLVLKIQLVNGEIWKLKFIIWLCTCSKHRYFVFERWFVTEEWVGGIASIGWFFMFFQQQTKRILWFGFSNFLCYNCWQFVSNHCIQNQTPVELDSWSQILPGKVWGKNKSYMALNQPEIQKVIMFCFTSEIWGELISGVWVWCFMILGWQRGGIVCDTERWGSFRNFKL